jgi:hypothetical protein
MAGILGSTPSYLERGTGLLSQAAQTRSMMQKEQPRYPEPEKTVGGGLLSGASMAAAGAVIGPEIASAVGTSALGGPIGLGIGAVVGLGAYLLS